MSQPTNVSQVLKRALLWQLWLALAIGILGGAIAFLLNGLPGLYSALIGAGIAAAFSSFTALAVLIGSRLSLGAFYAINVGGWVLKLVVFLLVVAVLKDADGIHRPTVFFSIVVSILGGLAIDAIVVMTSRVPVVEN